MEPSSHMTAQAIAARPPLREWWFRTSYSLRLHGRFYAMIARRWMGQSAATATFAANPADGITFVLPGVEGESPYVYNMRDGLRDAGIPGEVAIFDWCVPFPRGYFKNLMDLPRNRERAGQLTRRIMDHQHAHPSSPVHIVANSGGAYIALMAVEALPLDRPIEGVVLLGGAVSHGYCLADALARTRKGILNSYSSRDRMILGLGTQIFGTSDRKHSASCGHKGFTVPDADSPHAAAYGKLKQIAWQPWMSADCDHWGNHLTSASRKYVRKYIAPWVAA